MPRKSPFMRHRFSREIILCAVRWYLRFPLSYREVVDLLAERVQEFGPELTKRTETRLRRESLTWHVDETYIRVGGKWRDSLPDSIFRRTVRKGWRAVDAMGCMVDFRLTARREAKAAKAFLNKAIQRVRLHRPMTICTDKAHTYARVNAEVNHEYDPHFDSIRHIDKKWLNNRIESDHAAMKRLLGYRQSFRSLRSTKAVKRHAKLTPVEG